MPGYDPNRTIPKTQWTKSLLKDLLSALKAKRNDETVRAFAKELMDDKDLPISYLVHKAGKMIGTAEAERLDVLVRGRRAVDQSKAEQLTSEGGVRGFVRRFLR